MTGPAAPIPHDPIRGLIYATLATVLVACNFVTAKYGMGDERGGFNPETLAVVWMGSATMFALLWTVGTGQARSLVLRGRPLHWMIALGLTNAACQLTLWQGLQRLDPSFAAFLGRFAPVLAILMGALLLKERLRPWEWVAVVVMIGGGVWSSVGSFRLEWAGIVLSLLASFFAAAQFPVAKRGGAGLPSVTMNFYRLSVAAVSVTLYAVLTGKMDFTQAQSQHWNMTVAGAFVGPFLSYVFLFKSYQYWDMSRSAIVWTLQPLVVMPMAYVVFGTIPTRTKLIGGLVMVAATVWLAWLQGRKHSVPLDD